VSRVSAMSALPLMNRDRQLARLRPLSHNKRHQPEKKEDAAN